MNEQEMRERAYALLVDAASVVVVVGLRADAAADCWLRIVESGKVAELVARGRGYAVRCAINWVADRARRRAVRVACEVHESEVAAPASVERGEHGARLELAVRAFGHLSPARQTAIATSFERGAALTAAERVAACRARRELRRAARAILRCDVRAAEACGVCP